MRSRSSSISAILCLLFQQHTDYGCGHEVGHGAGEHGAQAEARELVAAFGDERADAADLNADGAEVGEAAEREGGDSEGARVECALERTEMRKGDELVDDHAGAEQIADDRRRMPGNADKPRDGREDPAQDLVERGGERNVMRAKPVVYAAEDAVDQGD